MATIQELAAELSQAFERRERDEGNHEPGLKGYVALRDGSPEWMTEVCHKAHGDMLPDDWRYEFIEDAADVLAEAETLDDARDMLQEYVYTHQVTGWLHSHLARYEYVEQAMAEWGDALDVIRLLMAGMRLEQEEVLGQVYAALEALADDSTPGNPANPRSDYDADQTEARDF